MARRQDAAVGLPRQVQSVQQLPHAAAATQRRPAGALPRPREETVSLRLQEEGVSQKGRQRQRLPGGAREQRARAKTPAGCESPSGRAGGSACAAAEAG